MSGEEVVRVKGLALCLLAAAALGLAGCNDVERPTSYNKGVYGGKADQKLTPEQVDSLRERLAHQK